jgi:hypothetical protein
MVYLLNPPKSKLNVLRKNDLEHDPSHYCLHEDNIAINAKGGYCWQYGLMDWH